MRKRGRVWLWAWSAACAAIVLLIARSHWRGDGLWLTTKSGTSLFCLTAGGGFFVSYALPTAGPPGIRYDTMPRPEWARRWRLLRFDFTRAYDRHGRPVPSCWELEFPLWVPLSVCACFAIRCWRVTRRPAPGLCPACGYDLRATPDRCPECGSVA